MSILPFKQATAIQAAIRQHTHEHQRGGNVLKAEVGNGHINQAHVPLTFTGTRTDDKRTGKLYKRVSYKLGLIPKTAFIKITLCGRHFF